LYFRLDVPTAGKPFSIEAMICASLPEMPFGDEVVYLLPDVPGF
jgi:hypothetical protein